MFDYQLYAPSTIMWNMPRAWKYSKKDVNVGKIKKAYEQVLAAHPVFRTVLLYDDACELMQHYDETLPITVPVEMIAEEDAAHVLQKLIQPFRLLNEPLYRARLFETEKSVYLFIDMHHMISDGISMQVFVEHLTRAYEGEALPEDLYYLFVRDKFKKHISGAPSEERAYFESRYGGKAWICGLTPEMESRESSFDNIVLPLGVEAKELETYCRKAEISRNAFLQTVALLTVAYMENADDVMLGWVYSGRDDPRMNSSIAMLIKEIPTALSLNDLPDVRSIYSSVRKQMNQGLVNGDYPYLTINSSAAENDVFCFIDEGDLLDLKGPGSFPSEEVPLVSTNALGWLMALVIFNKDGVYMNLNYASKRYHTETMERYCSLYQQIASRMMEARPETAIRDIFEKLH